MNSITKLFDLDFAALVPELDTFLGRICAGASLAVLIGPMLLLVLGMLYLLKPPSEANYRAGFRTYYGMGSIEAWRYTQRIAGLVWGSLGAAMTVIMGIVCLTFGGKDAAAVVKGALICLIIEVILIVATYIGIGAMASKHFDKDGNRRN